MRFVSRCSAWWIATVMCAIALPLCAQYTSGDVVVSVSRSVAPNDTDSWIKIYGPTGALRTEMQLPSQFALLDVNVHGGTLYGWAPAGFGGDVRVQSDGQVIGAEFAGRGSFVFDALGNAYSANAQTIQEFAPAGTFLREWTLPNAPAEIDLASDQCTMYYISFRASLTAPRAIDRFNVCTGQPLTQLIGGLPADLGNLRVLPGDEVLVGTGANILRISASGQITRTYAGVMQLALDPSGTSFWAANGLDSVSKIDLATGFELQRTANFGVFDVVSLTVVDEPRAALTVEAAVPTLAHTVLLLLAASIAVVGLFRLTNSG